MWYCRSRRITVIINLKIEVLKVFSLEFNVSSDKELKFKKDKPDEKESAPAAPTKQSSASK
jgi:hypothetical protein